MATKNDKVILNLKKEIEAKKQLLKDTERFSPITNCSIEVDGGRYNLNVIGEEVVISLLVKLNMYKLSAEDLGLEKEFKISGYVVEDWISDLKQRLLMIGRKQEEKKLKGLEETLHEMLSADTKVELKLDEIKKQIFGETEE